MLLRLIEMFEKIILAIISKLNIVIIMLILVLVGIMNRDEVFTWFQMIGKAFKTTFSF